MSEILRKQFLRHVAQTSPSPQLIEIARAEGVFFYTPEGDFVVNEINTLPGFTPISMYPKMMINEGISYSELIDRLIMSAING